jgi:hypothetical protein
MSKSNNHTISDILWIGGFFLALSLLLHGWATYKLWSWFIVPLGVPEIGFFHALGIVIFVGFVAGFRNSYSEFQNAQDCKIIIDCVLYLYVRPILVLVFGWLLHCFM